MRPHSRQILSVEEVFGINGWHAELVEGRDVLRAGFEAHHTRVDLVVQAFPELNALSVVGESPMFIAEPQMPALLELLMRGNKQLTLGSFEYDLDREMLVFRVTNLFEKDRFDGDIIASMVHCASPSWIASCLTPPSCAARQPTSSPISILRGCWRERMSFLRCRAGKRRSIEFQTPNSKR